MRTGTFQKIVSTTVPPVGNEWVNCCMLYHTGYATLYSLTRAQLHEHVNCLSFADMAAG